MKIKTYRNLQQIFILLYGLCCGLVLAIGVILRI